MPILCTYLYIVYYSISMQYFTNYECYKKRCNSNFYKCKKTNNIFHHVLLQRKGEVPTKMKFFWTDHKMLIIQFC